MTELDIKEYNDNKIENIRDFVKFWTKHYGMEYDWRNDDGEEHLIVWLKFHTLSSFTKLFNSDTIDECYEDFSCILRKNCIVFPHFENVLEHCDIDELEIKEIFE